MRILILLGRGLVFVTAWLLSVLLCLVLYYNQYDFEQEYNFTKVEWHTKTLPIDEVMTIGFRTSNLRFNFGLPQDYIVLYGYYGMGVTKLLPADSISNQIIYINQSNLPNSQNERLSYRINQVTLLESSLKNDYGYPIIFLKEGTIQAVVESWEVTTDTAHNVGKKIVTGTDFVKNKQLIKNNLSKYFAINTVLTAFLTTQIIFLGLKLRRKLNLFEKFMGIVISGSLICYLLAISYSYITTVS